MRDTSLGVLCLVAVSIGASSASCSEDRVPQGGVPSTSSSGVGGHGGEPTAQSSMMSAQSSTAASSGGAGGADGCNDGEKNGNETDVDCGGACPSPCAVGQGCVMNADCVSNVCTRQLCVCPDEMALVPVPGGGSPHCADKTEVTYAEYEVFWSATPSPSGQIPECQWNLNYTPFDNWPSINKQHPVTDINWCQAYAYCQHVGKRLCGKIGGGSNIFADYANAMMSQWFNACSGQGNSPYPYGGSYDPLACNGADYAEGTTVAVQTMSQQPLTTPPCQGGSPDLWQMSGNVREWEDSCTGMTGASDNCRVRGGSYLSLASELTCATPDQAARNFTANDVGFRCCL